MKQSQHRANSEANISWLFAKWFTCHSSFNLRNHLEISYDHYLYFAVEETTS